MGDEIDIREDIAQLIRDVAAPRDAEIARLRAKCAILLDAPEARCVHAQESPGVRE